MKNTEKKTPVRRETKTRCQTGHHEPVGNPTTNYPMDGHKLFCKRCRKAHGKCPVTGRGPAASCRL